MSIVSPTIIADTPDYAVINKPAGLLAHPTVKKESATLANWLVNKYPEIKAVGESPERPGIVHRLDREASGVMVVAKTQSMFDHLKKQFQERDVEKQYVVLVHGRVAKDHGFIDFPIGRGEAGRMASRPNRDPLTLAALNHEEDDKTAVTEFLVKTRFTRFTLLEVTIHTGRMHQIRVHFFAYNHPVVGDTIYMNKKLNLKRDHALGRLFLHAQKLCFANLAGERVCYEAELPDELKKFLEQLK